MADCYWFTIALINPHCAKCICDTPGTKRLHRKCANRVLKFETGYGFVSMTFTLNLCLK